MKLLKNFDLLLPLLISLLGLYLQYDYSLYFENNHAANEYTNMVKPSLIYQILMIGLGLMFYYLFQNIFARYKQYSRTIFFVSLVITLVSACFVFFGSIATNYDFVIAPRILLDFYHLGTAIMLFGLFSIAYLIENSGKYTDYFVALLVLAINIPLIALGLKFVVIFYLILIVMAVFSSQRVISFPLLAATAFIAYIESIKLTRYFFSAKLHSYLYKSDPNGAGYIHYYSINDIKTGGFFGTWQHYKAFDLLGSDTILNTKQVFISQILVYKFGLLSLIVVCIILAVILRYYIKLQNRYNLIYLASLSYLIMICYIPVADSLNLIPFIPMLPMAFMGYGLEAIVIPYALLGILKGYNQNNKN